jgi:hypothetical protein
MQPHSLLITTAANPGWLAVRKEKQMADYFTYFSFAIKLKDAEGHKYGLDLADKVARYRSNDEPVPEGLPVNLVDVLEDWWFEVEASDGGLWLHSTNGGIDAVCAFVQHLLQKFDPEGRVEFQWSHDCSKPRFDAYGGGAAIITAQEVLTMNTSDWLRSHAVDVLSTINN